MLTAWILELWRTDEARASRASTCVAVRSSWWWIMGCALTPGMSRGPKHVSVPGTMQKAWKSITKNRCERAQP